MFLSSGKEYHNHDHEDTHYFYFNSCTCFFEDVFFYDMDFFMIDPSSAYKNSSRLYLHCLYAMKYDGWKECLKKRAFNSLAP